MSAWLIYRITVFMSLGIAQPGARDPTPWGPPFHPHGRAHIRKERWQWKSFLLKGAFGGPPVGKIGCPSALSYALSRIGQRATDLWVKSSKENPVERRANVGQSVDHQHCVNEDLCTHCSALSAEQLIEQCNPVRSTTDEVEAGNCQGVSYNFLCRGDMKICTFVNVLYYSGPSIIGTPTVTGNSFQLSNRSNNENQNNMYKT